MSVVAVVGPSGASAVTTTALALALSWPSQEQVVLAECDPSGGDLAAFCNLTDTVGFASATSSSWDGSWPGLAAHLQSLANGVRVLAAPIRAAAADVSVGDITARLAPLMRELPDVLLADCGRVHPSDRRVQLLEPDVLAVVVRQHPESGPATITRLERTAELVDALTGAVSEVVVVLVGARPYPTGEVERFVGVDVVGVVDEDAPAAAQLSGRRRRDGALHRSALLASARVVSAKLAERSSRSLRSVYSETSR
jgi:MinD-like ATPase involved in chromosome partitioning or flagellar assembly